MLRVKIRNPGVDLMFMLQGRKSEKLNQQSQGLMHNTPNEL